MRFFYIFLALALSSIGTLSIPAKAAGADSVSTAEEAERFVSTGTKELFLRLSDIPMDVAIHIGHKHRVVTDQLIATYHDLRPVTTTAEDGNLNDQRTLQISLTLNPKYIPQGYPVLKEISISDLILALMSGAFKKLALDDRFNNFEFKILQINKSGIAQKLLPEIASRFQTKSQADFRNPYAVWGFNTILGGVAGAFAGTIVGFLAGFPVLESAKWGALSVGLPWGLFSVFWVRKVDLAFMNERSSMEMTFPVTAQLRQKLRDLGDQSLREVLFSCEAQSFFQLLD